MTDGGVSPCFLGAKSVPCDVTPLNEQWVPSGIEAETSQASPQRRPRVLGHHCPQLLAQQRPMVAGEVATRARVLLAGVSTTTLLTPVPSPFFKIVAGNTSGGVGAGTLMGQFKLPGSLSCLHCLKHCPDVFMGNSENISQSFFDVLIAKFR